MAKFDSKSFNPQAFAAYVKNVPNVIKSELAKSKAIGTNEQAKTTHLRDSENDLRNAEDFGIDLGRRPGGDHFLDVTEV